MSKAVLEYVLVETFAAIVALKHAKEGRRRVFIALEINKNLRIGDIGHTFRLAIIFAVRLQVSTMGHREEGCS